MKASTVALVAIVLALASAALWSQWDRESKEARTSRDVTKPTGSAGTTSANNAGPAEWDAAGRFRCSVDNTTFVRTCGYRLVYNRNDKSVDIWVRNLAKNKAEYRTLRYADDAFGSNDGSKVTWRRQGENWQVSVDGKEYYAIPDRLLRLE